ncbi:protein GVQW3-like [Ornithodoros turicata]|uniref:protein GVQW3-like n=1 Tax=Ornithodoros turicata TaxID=34597 RepID=UPI00313917BE
MANNEVRAHTEQRIVMKFLANEGVKSSEIYRRLQAQYGHDILRRSKAFEWCKRFRDGCTSVQDDPGRGGSEPSVRVHENIQLVERLILKDRRITCLKLARKTGLSVGRLSTIIQEHLQLRKWKHPGSPATKKFRSTPSAGEVMTTVFWDKAGVVHVDFQPTGTTINSAYYCQVLRDVHKKPKPKRPGLITKGVLLL